MAVVAQVHKIFLVLRFAFIFHCVAMADTKTTKITVDIWNVNNQTRDKFECATKKDAIEQLRSFLTKRELVKFYYDTNKYDKRPIEWTHEECEQIIGREMCGSLAKDVLGSLFIIYVTSE